MYMYCSATAKCIWKKVNKGTNNDTCWEECSCRGHLVSEMQRTHDHLQSIQRKLYDKIEEPSKTESFNLQYRQTWAQKERKEEEERK